MAIMCNNAKLNGKRKGTVASINFLRTKVYSKPKCRNKLVPTGGFILHHNWIKRFSYKSLKISPSKWLVVLPMTIIGIAKKGVKLSVHYQDLKE